VCSKFFCFANDEKMLFMPKSGLLPTIYPDPDTERSVGDIAPLDTHCQGAWPTADAACSQFCAGSKFKLASGRRRTLTDSVRVHPYGHYYLASLTVVKMAACFFYHVLEISYF